MSLYTKCIFAEKEPIDGLRASIMSRHTENDGKTRNPNLDGTYDIHLLAFAPHPELVGAYYRKEIGWDEFREEYILGLGKPEVREAIDFWGRFAFRQNLTFLCVEPYIGLKTRCHRILVVNEFQDMFPDLIVEHR